MPTRHARAGRADRRDGRPHRHRLPVRRPVLGARRLAAVRHRRQRQHQGPWRGRRRVLAAACRAWCSAKACALVSRVTQGCQPVVARTRDHRGRRQRDLALDGEPALDVLLARPAGLAGRSREQAIDAVRATLVGLVDAGSDGVAAHRRPRRRRPWCATSSASTRRVAAWRSPTTSRPGMRHELLPPQRAGRARRPDAHLRGDPRGAGAGGADAGDRHARGRGRRGRGRAASGAPHRRRDLRQLLRAAAARISARPAPSCRSCGMPSATCRWSASSPPARSPATTCTATPAC